MLSRILRQVFLGGSRKPVDVFVDEGNVLAAAGDHAGALVRYERAITLDPESAVAHNNRSLSLHALGRMPEAWAESEWRFLLQDKTRRFVSAPPVRRWDGHPFAGSLIVLWEQGLGDMLQHLRFLPLAAGRVGKLAMLCPPALADLVCYSFPDTEMIEARRGVTPDWRRFDACVPLLSLPYLLGLTVESLPAQPYLDAPRENPRRVPREGGFHVGIVWRSSAYEQRRDCSLAAMLALAQSGARLVSLQHRLTADEQDLLERAGVEQRAGETLLQTASEAMQLDAVVSVDTSVLHLAAALGRPTIGLLNEPYAVRWTMRGGGSPWYPTLRLVRKRGPESWAGPVAEATLALREIFEGT